MGLAYAWALVIAAIFVCAVWVFEDWEERVAIRRDLAKKGCVARRITWLPWRRGLLEHLGGRRGILDCLLFDSDDANCVVYGRAYKVAYINRDGTRRVAVCMMGPDDLVFWTDEHPEPGFDRFGNPPNLPDHGQNWRG